MQVTNHNIIGGTGTTIDMRGELQDATLTNTDVYVDSIYYIPKEDYEYWFREDKPIPNKEERRSFEHIANIKGKNYERNLHTVKTLHKSSRNREHKYLRQLPDIKRK